MARQVADQIRDSRKWRRLNGWLVIAWLVILPVSVVSGMLNILAFTAIISVYANVAAHLGVWAAARAEDEANGT